MWHICSVGCRYTGVHAVDGSIKYYTAYTTIHGPQLVLGCYSTEKQAAMSYDHYCIYQVVY